MVRLLNEIKWGYNTFCSYGILPQVVLVAFWRQLIVTFCGSLTDSKYPPLAYGAEALLPPGYKPTAKPPQPKVACKRTLLSN